MKKEIITEINFPGIKTSYVILVNYSASLDAVKHLITTGRKRIAMITYDSGLVHLQERTNGYIAALEQNALGFDKNLLKLVEIENDRQAIENAVNGLLATNPCVDTVLFGSNKIATCSLKFINSLSVKVTQDLVVICFDHTQMLDLFYSPVTYVKQPLEEIGWLAIKSLIENMKDIATASNSFEVKQLRIPKNRSFTIDSNAAMMDAPIYRYPFQQFAEATLAVNSSGMAMRFIDVCSAPEANKAYRLTEVQLMDARKQLQTARQHFYTPVIHNRGRSMCSNHP